MAIIWNTRNNGGGYSGYTNGAWSSFMNTYSFSLIPQSGSAQSGRWFYASYNVYFPNTGTYTIRAAVDNAGTLSVDGVGCSISGFGSSGNTTSIYRSRGTYTVFLGMYNTPSDPDLYSNNPMGMAVTIDAPPPPPYPSVSISVDPTSLIRGNSTTLSWSSSGIGLYSVSVTDVSSPGYSGSATVSPANTKTYTIQTCGESGCSSASATVTVYIPPIVTLTLDRNPIIAGESTTLRWSTTGDANTISWTSGGITNLNLNSNSTVNPTTSRTYTASVSGAGGSDTDSITLTVYQIPTVSITVPTSLNYGEQGTITYSSSYTNTSLKITPTYYYDTAVAGTVVNLTRPNSAEQGVGTTSVSGSITTSIPYTDRGPRSVTYLIEGVGSGGTASQSATVTINIDETPQNIIVPESEDLFKNQDPVITPDVTVVSSILEVDDIDIPVEVKASRPIQVDVNGQLNWINIRQI